jgi:hypothetical protein
MSSNYAGYSHTVGVDFGDKFGVGDIIIMVNIGDNSLLQDVPPVSILGVRKPFVKLLLISHTVGVDFQGQVWSWG